MAQIHEHDLGLTWVMDGEPMQRASHALADDGRVWIVDPVDDAQALERVAQLGTPVAVLMLLDRHKRDCQVVADRLGIPLLTVPESLSDAPFVCHRVIRKPLWKEVALWWPEREGLVVAEVLGTADVWALTDRPVGVHPMVRLLPPNGLRRFTPRTLLVGHGPPVTGPDTAALMEDAIAHSRREAPRLIAKIPDLIKTGRQL
jgi:hypothetical protein